MGTRGCIKLFANRSGEQFAQKISNELKLPLSKMTTKDFADTESKPTIEDSVRGCDVYLVQSCFDPNSDRSVQDNFFEFLAAGDALVNAGCDKLTGILPYHPFERQDKIEGREPATARLAIQCIEAARFDNIITTDLHSKQIESFYRTTKIDNLPADKYLINELRCNYQNFFADKIKTIGPDANAAKIAEKYAIALGIKAAQAFKMRDLDSPNKVASLKIAGLVDERNILVVDDMIDTAGTLEKLVLKLMEIGSEEIIGCFTHALLNPPAIGIIEKYNIEVIATDTIPRTEEWKRNHIWYKEVSIAPLHSKAIKNLNQNKSISNLYNNPS